MCSFKGADFGEEVFYASLFLAFCVGGHRYEVSLYYTFVCFPLGEACGVGSVIVR